MLIDIHAKDEKMTKMYVETQMKMKKTKMKCTHVLLRIRSNINEFYLSHEQTEKI